MHAETLRETWKVKLPFAGYSVVIPEFGDCRTEGIEDLNPHSTSPQSKNQSSLNVRLSGTIGAMC